MKNKVLFYLIYLSPLICITLGLIAFTVAAFLINNILGVAILGLSFVMLGIMLIPLRSNIDKEE